MEEYYFTLSCRTKPAILLKVTFVHECFSRFLNCTNGSKPGKASHMLTFEREAYRVWRFAGGQVCAHACVRVRVWGAEGCRSLCHLTLSTFPAPCISETCITKTLIFVFALLCRRASKGFMKALKEGTKSTRKKYEN